MKIALVSAFLEDDVYENKLDDRFMNNVICSEDHFYHRIAKSLMKNDLEPVVFYMSQEKELKKFTHKYGHELIRVPANRYRFIHEPIVYSPKLVEIISNDFDICNFVSGYYVNYKIPDMFDYTVFKLHKKMPIVARWAGGNHKWLFPIRKTIKKKALQKCDKIICSGTDEITILNKVFGIDSEKIIKIMNPIDLDLFKERNREKSAENIEIDPSYRYLLYVGRFSENKGIELLLNCFKKLKNLHSDLKLILIGDGPLKKFIIEFIEKNQLQQSIIMPGRLSHENICYYYNVASVLINIGSSGGLPNVVIESIASRLPVIATNVGASRDYVGEKFGNGVLIDQNEDQLESALEFILSNEKKFRGREINRLDEFSFNEYGKKLKKTYQELLEITY